MNSYLSLNLPSTATLPIPMIPMQRENIIIRIVKKNKKILKSMITVVNMVTIGDRDSYSLKKKNVLIYAMSTTTIIAI